MKYHYITSLVLILLLLAPFSVGAHGTGAYFETSDETYVIDVGYSSPAPQDGESVIFDFQLRKKTSSLTSGTDVSFSDVWVKIESEDKSVVFASGIHNAEFGGPRMSYVFPKEGKYVLSVRYENSAGSLTETSFPMTVVPKISERTPFLNTEQIVPLVLGFCIGIGAGVVSLRSRKKSSKNTDVA